MRIRIDISNEQNRKMLVDFLGKRYEIAEDNFDLLIIDGVTLKRKWREIERIKAESRAFLPVLLVTTRKDLKIAEKHLWKRVDELIIEPVDKLELLARIEILLRARKQALQLEEHARIMEIELGTLFETIAHPIVVISPEFEILHANRYAQKIFREQGIENAIGKKCYKVFHGREEPAENCPCVATFRNHKPETREIEIFGRMYAVSTTPIFIDGELRKVVHLAFDITDFKRMERRLERLYKANLLLHEVERAILSADETEEILKMTAEKLAEMLPVRGVGITVFENGRARVVAVTDKKMPGFREGEMIAGEDVAKVMQTLSQGKPWVKRVEGRGEGERRLMELGIKSYALIPIVSDSLLGSINVPSEEEDAFDEETIQILMEVAHSVALAIRSARMREELEESEEKFRKLAEHSQVGIDIIQEGVFVYVNEKFAEILGYEREELIGKSPVDFIHPDDREKFERNYRARILGEKNHVNYRLRVLTKSGEVRIIDAYGSRVILRGKPAIVGVSVDITEREKMRQELEKYTQELEKLVEERTKQLAESEKRYRLLVESPIVAFWEADSNGVFRFVNDRLLEMSGYSRDEVVGKMTMFDPIAPEQREWLAERIRLHKEHKLYGDVVEAELVKKDGSRFHVLVSPAPIYDEKGNLVKNIGAMIDITDRKMAEEKLKQTLEELRKANEELEAYVHAISHDLRAPLRNLQGYVSALVEDYGEKLEEDARFYLSRLKALTEKMDGLINDLLEYARVSKAKAEVRRVDLNLIVEDVLDYLKDEIRGKSAVIEIEKLPAVKGDRKLLFTVMLNLISNAIKFVEEGVRPEVKVWAEDVNGKVRVYVKDNGIGIPEEYHEKIFNIFERLHGEEVYPGTGVGLAIVKKAMEVMGGRYGVRSKPGEGSIFWIELERG